MSCNVPIPRPEVWVECRYMSCTCQIDRPFFIEGFVAFPVLTRTHCPPAFLFAVVGVEPSKPTVVWKMGLFALENVG